MATTRNRTKKLGRPTKAKTKKKHNKSFTLNYHTVNRTARLSDELGISQSEFVNRALDRYGRQLMNNKYRDRAEARGVNRSSAWGVKSLPEPHVLPINSDSENISPPVTLDIP